MKWKEWPYWLRGVLIASLMMIILILIQLKFFISIVGFLPGYIVLTFFGQLLQNFLPNLFSGGDNWFYYLSGIIVYIIVGAIIGLIIGKIKKNDTFT